MKRILPIILVLISTVQLFGQKPQPKPTQTPNQSQCSLDLVKTLIEQQAIESKNIEDTGKRLKVLYLAADFLWKYDEQTARDYLSKAFDLAVDRFNEKNKKQFNANSNFVVISEKDYRFQVLQTISKYDIAWAKKLSEKIFTDYENADKTERNDWEKTLEIDSMLNLAVDVFDQNQQMSEALLNRVMNYQFTQFWFYTLYRLAEKNQQFADKIYAKLLVNYTNAKFKDLLYFSNYPFGISRLNSLWSSLGYEVKSSFVQNPNLQKQYLSLILQRALNYQPNQQPEDVKSWDYPDTAYLYHILQTKESIVRNDFPELSENWSLAETQIFNFINEKDQKRLNEKYESEKTSKETTFETRLKKLEDDDANGKLTDANIFSIIQSAKNEEEYAKLESWLDKIKAEKMRDSVTLYFYYLRTDLAIKENRLDEARKFATKISELEFRALLFLKIAEKKLKQPQGKIETNEILYEIHQLALKSDNSPAKVQTLFALTSFYAKLDKNVAINVLSNAITTFNTIENKDAALSSNIQIFIQGERFSSMTMLKTIGTDFKDVFGELVKSDFRLALSQANSFSDKYYRALAVIEVAKNCPELTKVKATKTVKSKP